jgi:hypothetical protein
VSPHVYGPIELQAIEGVGVLGKTSDGYAWPEEFFPIDVALDRSTEPDDEEVIQDIPPENRRPQVT